MEVNENLVRSALKEMLQKQGMKDTSSSDDCVSASCDAEKLYKEKDRSGIIKIKPQNVPLEPFGQRGVSLKDVLSLEEAPRMGCGIMALDCTSFEWTLTYDEYDLVLEGELEIEIDGRIVSAGPGEIIYIPKDSHIHFQSKSHARYAYFVYPADWQN